MKAKLEIDFTVAVPSARRLWVITGSKTHYTHTLAPYRYNNKKLIDKP